MTLIEKKSEKIFILHIKVRPNAKTQNIIIEDKANCLQINLTSKPIQNKANKELLKLLRKKFKLNTNQIQIISGIKSKNKLIQIIYDNPTDEKEILKKLLE